MTNPLYHTLIVDNIVQSLNMREMAKFMLTDKMILKAVKQSHKFKLVHDLCCLAKDNNTMKNFNHKISVIENKMSLKEYLFDSFCDLYRTYPIILTSAGLISLVLSPVIIPLIGTWTLSSGIRGLLDRKWYYNPKNSMLWVSCMDKKYLSLTKELLNDLQDQVDKYLVEKLCHIAIVNQNVEFIIDMADKIKLLDQTTLLLCGIYAHSVGNLKIAEVVYDVYQMSGHTLTEWRDLSCRMIGMNNCCLLENLAKEHSNIDQKYIDDGFLRACKNTDLKTLEFLTQRYHVDIRMKNDGPFNLACRTGNYEVARVLSSLCPNYVVTTSSQTANDSYSYIKICGGDFYLKYKIN